MKMVDEPLICFGREIVSTCEPGPIIAFDETLWQRILDNLVVLARSKVENDARYKQLTVFVLLATGKSFLSYRRTSSGSEERLRNVESLGVGGHVNATDKDKLHLFDADDTSVSIVLSAVWREIGEELVLGLTPLPEPEMLCFINDDSTEVSSAHFGVVFLLRLPDTGVRLRRRPGMGGLSFRNLQELLNRRNEYESWSRFLIDYLSSSGLEPSSNATIET